MHQVHGSFHCLGDIRPVISSSFNIAKSLVFSGEYDDWVDHGDNNSGTW